MYIEIDDYEVLDMLLERVRYWTDNEDVVGLFEQMYERSIDDKMWDGSEFNVMTIVDNDYVNWCDVIYEDDDLFVKLKEVYLKQGIGDCSCEVDRVGFIEAVDNEKEPKMFLIRW